jgi:hypothetical protein
MILEFWWFKKKSVWGGCVISTHLTRYFISKLSPSLAYLKVMDNCLGIGGVDVVPADPIALGAHSDVHSTKSCNVFVFWGEGGMDSVFLTDSNFLVP